MKKLMFVAAVAAVLVGCETVKCPQDSGTTFAREALQPFVDSGELPGAISVFYQDGVQETCCVGYADVEAKRPITLDDVYMQCSQTKGFCGVTIAMLVEEGKLKLDDPVSKYIPEFGGDIWVLESETNGVRKLRKAKTPITVRMVMNHTSGLPFEMTHYTAMGGWSRRMPLQSAALTATTIPLLFEPGTSVQYSNIGIDIGAAVVERITGKRWEDFVQERILDPLGMTSSTFWPTEEQLATRIQLYDQEKGKVAKWVEYNPSMQPPFGDDRVFSSAGAGLWTTARDQLKFYKMLANLGEGENGVRILKAETVKSILAVSTRDPYALRNWGPGGGYSLGLNAPLKDGENEWFGHGGAWSTNCSVNWHKKQVRLFVVQLSKKDWNWQKPLGDAATKFFKAREESGVSAYTGRMN